IRILRGPDLFRRRKSSSAGRARGAGALAVQAAATRAGDFRGGGAGHPPLPFSHSRQRRFAAGLLSNVLSFWLWLRRRRSARPLEHWIEAGGKCAAAIERAAETHGQWLVWF